MILSDLICLNLKKKIINGVDVTMVLRELQRSSYHICRLLSTEIEHKTRYAIHINTNE